MQAETHDVKSNWDRVQLLTELSMLSNCQEVENEGPHRRAS
jgi:hypothetical protein